MSRSRNIAQLPKPGRVYNQGDMIRLVNTIEQLLIRIDQIIQEGYSTSNVTTTRSFDANATTLDEVADVLGTLIEDMKARGRLG